MSQFDPDDPPPGDEEPEEADALGSSWRDQSPDPNEWADELDDAGRWPLTWRELWPRERWLWFERLWTDVCALRRRYRLAVRWGWWEDEVQLEALAALAAWVARYDSGEWDDPPGKLALLFDLERVGMLLRDGLDPFHPERDRAAFLAHLHRLGCQPPPEPGPRQ